MKPLWLMMLLVGVLLTGRSARADATVTQMCPATGVQARGADYPPGGIILTAFDKSAIWVYNVDSGHRYPLPETTPCGSNCRLSPDATWLTFFNDPTNTFNIMHLDGTQRALVAENAAEVDWWDATTYLIWTPGKGAYLQTIGSSDREYLDVSNVVAIQPGGRYGIAITPKDDGFERSLVNLALRGQEGISDNPVDLGADQAYFNAESWSSDGQWLAFVAPVAAGNGQTGGELFAIQPGESAPTQWTQLIALYGAERINGVSVGELSWSPDNTRIAFWVTPITGADVMTDVGSAVIHILDVNTGDLTVYCGFSTSNQTPNPPRLVWSPDSTHLAFGGALPNDKSGYYLLGLDTSTGAITSLSQGVYPVFGSPDVLAWGKSP